MAASSTYIKETSFEDFDPNDMNQGTIVWGLYDGHRFRTYPNRPPVLSAFKAAYKAKLYHMDVDTGRWKLVAVMPTSSTAKGKPCEWCGSDANPDGWRSDSAWAWRKVGGKIPKEVDQLELVYLCAVCKQVNG